MSETQSPQPTHSPSPDSGSEPIEEWTPAPVPGTVHTTDKTAGDKISSKRETELLTLIHDLNDCNDVLLSRVSQLETALQDARKNAQSQSQSAQAAQAQAKAQIQAQMAEQVSAIQASAQQTSKNAQQQVANVVAQLETSEQALQRQQLINETLQSELTNAQERVSQLEHECAAGAQRHAEEAQARVQAENTVRDLRSRLQRQQRYTLQFKAALEKSLTVTARSASTRSVSTKPTAFSTTFQDASDSKGAVPMPRAQRITPWAGAVTTPFEGIDPHLENLIRGASQPTCDVVHHDLEIRSAKPLAKPLEQSQSEASDSHNKAPGRPSSEPSDSNSATASATSTDAVAEDKLWQDIERVIEHASEGEAIATPLDSTTDDIKTELEHSGKAPEKTTATAQAADESAPGNESSLPKTAPKLNWQQNATQVSTSQASATQSSTNQTAESSPPADEPSKPSQPAESAPSGLKSIVIDPYTVPAGQVPADEVSFTEPSPWGKPLAEKVKASGEALGLDNSDTVPAVAPRRRPQQKIGSMSAVQLPTFGKAKAASFRR